MKKGVKIIIGLGVFTVIAVLAAWLVDRKLKDLGHPGIRKFAHQLAVNYPKGFAVEPLILEIRVKDNDLAHLEQVVEEARARGVIVPEGNEYVPAEVITPSGSFKAKIRIKGKLTDHVKGNKWSFRVIGKKNGGFLGMRRFSLQHPGTRNYLYDWFYHKLMAGEGIIALRYGFIRLNFNGEDLGVYAYEEHFGPELLENNQRSEGPIFRFDPGLYWEHRLNDMQKLKVNAPYAEYQAATVDAYGSSDIAEDPELRRQFEEAVALIDAFRRGKAIASQVFDADKIAKRHAILDLIGGHHSMDFSDVKFYYDPIAKKVEPVAYESFSAFPIRTLAGSNRFTGKVQENQDLHDAYFNDPSLFRSYVHHLERVSRTDYLDSTFNVLAPAMDSASAIIYQEFPWKEMDRSIFYTNQKVIRRLLDVPKGFHAHLQRSTGDTLEIVAIPIEALPIEVHGLQIAGGELIEPIKPVIVPCRLPGRMGEPVTIKFLATTTSDVVVPTMKISYSVLGASQRKELEVFPFALDPDLVIPTAEGKDLASFPFLQIDENTKEIFIRNGSWKIESDLVIPAGYEVLGTAPLELDLITGAQLISSSPIELKGFEEQAVRILSSDQSGGSITLIGTGTASKWERVEIESTGPADSGAMITFQNAPIEMSNCRIGGDPSRDLLLIVRSSVHLQNCTLAGGLDQLRTIYSRVVLKGLDLYGAQDDGMTFSGGMVDLQNVRVENSKGTAIKVNARAEINAKHVDLIGVDRGYDLGEGSSFILDQGSIRANQIGLVVEKMAMRYGPVGAKITGLTIEAAQPMKIGEGNEISIDGEAPGVEKAQAAE